MLTRVAVLVFSCFVAAAGAGCGDDRQAQPASGVARGDVERFPRGTPMQKIQERGELIVGIKFDAPPFGFKDPRSNDVQGFDADMAALVAKKLGVKVRFSETISDNRIPFLQNGRIDVVFATMTIKPDREEEIDFTDPYYISQGRVLVNKADTEIKDAEDLNGKRVCVTVGSTFNQSVRDAAPRAQLRGVNGYSECVQLMLTDAVDAVATEDVVLTGLLIQNPDKFKVVGDSFTEEPFGAAIAEQQPEMLEFLNETLGEIKRSGAWQESYHKWVGRYTDVRLKPPTMSLEQALEAAQAE